MKEFLKKNFKWIILFICLITVIAIIEDVFDDEIVEFDSNGYRIISTNLMSDFATSIAKFITNLGGAKFLIIITIIFVLAIKNKNIGIAISLNLLISIILNIVLKNILQRPRPEGYRLINVTGYSLPSGHSMVNTAFYGFLIYLVYKNVKNKYAKSSLIALLSVLIIAICISRIYLGVHYLSDVLAGFLIAISYLIIFISILEKRVEI